MTMNGNPSDATRIDAGPSGQAPDVTVAPAALKALWDEAMAIRARLEQLKGSGPEAKAERERLRQRYHEIDRLMTSSHAQAKEGANDGVTGKAPGDAEEWAVGDVILEQYEVKAELGEGGMGKVFQVHDHNWDMDLAVKTPKAASFQTETQKANFVRECHTWMDLGLHHHIVTCHHVRVLGGIPRVFAEYVEGGSLKDWIDDGKLYEDGTDKALERILDIAIQFAMGLHYAHEKGLIHQDIKPANVMMTPKGVVKLTDFGLANARAVLGEIVSMPHGASILASYGGMTPAYCSPEQADNAARRQAGTPVDQIPKLTRRTDLYSWAVSVLEMFTGAVTWQAGNVAGHALESFLQHGPDEDDLPAMPAQMAHLLRQCLQLDPDARPHDMDAVAKALRDMYKTVTGRVYPRETPAPATEMADVLNNKAVSFLELGRREEAVAMWDRALEIHPDHVQATYNRGLVLWRNGEESDSGLLMKLEQCEASAPDDPEAPLCIGHLHMERMAFSAAAEAFKRAEARKGGDKARRAREQAEKLVPEEPRCIQIFEGHKDSVNSVCLSADGRRALSGSWDHTLRLWDVSTGKCVRIFEGHTSQVDSVYLSLDGRWALSGSRDKTLRLWEVGTGECVRIFEGHTSDVNSVCLSVDVRWALSGSADKTLRLWEVTTGQCVRVFEGHKDSVNSVCLSADGRWALSGGSPNELRLWEVATSQCVRIFEGHTNRVASVCLSVNGRWALSGSWDRTLRLWEVATGTCARIFEDNIPWVHSVHLSVDGHWALSGSGDNTLRLWEAAMGKCVRTFEGHTNSVASVCLSTDGRWALSGSSDRTLRLWGVAGLTAGGFPLRTPLALCRVATVSEVLQDSSALKVVLKQAFGYGASGEWPAALKAVRRARELRLGERNREALDRWHAAGLHSIRTGLRAGWHLRTFEGNTEPVYSVCLSGDGCWALSGGGDSMDLWDVSTGNCVRTFGAVVPGPDDFEDVSTGKFVSTLGGHTSQVDSVYLSLDGRWALSGSRDKTLRLWEVGTGECVRIFEGHTSDVNSVCLSVDVRWALSGSADKTLRLWEVATGKCVRVFEGHMFSVSSVCLSGDGRYVLSGSQDIMLRPGTLRMLELSTGHCVRTFEGHTSPVSSVCLSVDGCWALSGSDDGTLRLWEVATGQCVRIFEGHTSGVNSICLSTDGRWALSGSEDNTLRLWDVSTDTCIRVFKGHTGWVTSVCLSVDGRWALSGSWDNTLRLWELDWDYEAHEPSDWDEGARPYLENFLTLCTPYAGNLPQGREPSEKEVAAALTRKGKPNMDMVRKNFRWLLNTLANAGYGWLRPEGVCKELEKMAANWTGPPSVGAT